MFLLEAVLVARAQLVDRLQVDFVERRQHRGRRLRLHQALGDARTQARHRHARSPRSPAGTRRRRCGGRCWPARGGGAGAASLPARCCQHVALGDATIATGARDRRRARACAPRPAGAPTAPACRRLPSLVSSRSACGAATSPGSAADVAAGGGAASRPPRRLLRSPPGPGRSSRWRRSATFSSLSTPLAGAGTSSTTLSVSRSTRFSSRLTASPGCLRHATSVASATDSGSCGTRTSTAHGLLPAAAGGAQACGGARAVLFRVLAVSAALTRPCCSVACSLHDAGRRRGGRRAARSTAAPGCARAAPAGDGGSGTTRPGSAALPGTRRPRAHSGTARARPRSLRPGTDRAARCARSRRCALRSARRASSRSKYTLPEQNTTRVDAFAGSISSISSMTSRKAAVRQIFERRDRQLVPQQALRRHHDQRLAERAHHLPAQHVEHLRGRRRHAHLHVVLGAELQEALEARRGMLRPLPFVAVRQEQREPADAAPLGLARADELVDDHLRAVREVAELALPRSRGSSGSVIE